MRIISKYWDFYDSPGTAGDDSLTWIRRPEWKKNPDGARRFRIIGSGRETRLGWTEAGFYPFVYRFPVIYETSDNPNPKIFFPTPGEFKDPKVLEKIVFDRLGLRGHDIVRKNRRTVYGPFGRDVLPEEPFSRTENQDLFKDLGTPVFARSGNVPLLPKCLPTGQERSGEPSLVTDAVFTLFGVDVLRGIRDSLDPLEIYNNIENYLWSVKAEPVSEPSNDVRILAAGFDLKTSFRKT